MTDEEETATRETEKEEERRESHPIGHHVVQDNVSEPGVQKTHQVGPDGEILQTSTHNEEQAAEEGGQTPAEDRGETPLDGAAAKKEAQHQGLLEHEGETDEEHEDGQVESDSALLGSGPGAAEPDAEKE